MASEDYVAIKSEQLTAAAREERYVIVNRWTREVVDNCNGHGYKSAQSAHKSWAYKQRQRSQRQGGHQNVGNQTGGNRANGYRQQGSWRSSYRTAADPKK